jgi:hypothetical protein
LRLLLSVFAEFIYTCTAIMPGNLNIKNKW